MAINGRNPLPIFLDCSLPMLLLFCIIGLLAWPFCYNFIASNDDLLFFSHFKNMLNEGSYDMVIGIVSARNNSKLRQAIRDTWLGALMTNQQLITRKFKILVKFIVGDSPCMIPPVWREDQYTCQKKIIRNSSDVHSVVQLKSNFEYSRDEDTNHYFSLGIRFTVYHPIVISSLGMINFKENRNKGTKLYLYDEISQQTVAHTTFNHNNPGRVFHNFRYSDIGYYLLPKGFIGCVFAENITNVAISRKRSDWILDEGENAIKIFELKLYNHDTNGIPREEEFMLKRRLVDIGLSFQYKIKEEATITANYTEDEYKELLNEEREALHQEMVAYDDIVLVPHMDVYRTLASKMLLFYDWLMKNLEFQLFMKVDDDCFVNINSIVEAIHSLDLLEKRKFWWGNFRSNWPVERFGKWSELDYNCPIYPAFACGSGSILTADIIKWLANNRQWLKPYQVLSFNFSYGEDVSMGIWMTALAPLLIKVTITDLFILTLTKKTL
ncbi:uncharacterized protein TRIADDRAFT_52586 [Trichoplax adhaerens]|uniref:Hexosyltransferase n=1 Tax=Trichoplax adhaerens TaxID=10228 RepID=B3RJD5_TRIAD|nr:hypothetical protein TRIADDRAFT_52586 [Trichoplax adhaerens]EDV29073.1 hypothetical protein TRIADDRAFT_52586 [Trichoplax adhaerens]|eukprot:XP_002108275.1 hypothetical protein TRIADDRAFT_52586 [Trichoplax adhaerens]